MIEHGVDIVEIKKVKELLIRHKNRRDEIFTENERIYCESKKDKYKHYAGRFAAKEAVLKTLGMGWGNKVKWNEIEICNDKSGKPYIRFFNKLLRSQDLNENSLTISISHCENYAIASAILEFERNR